MSISDTGSAPPSEAERRALTKLSIVMGAVYVAFWAFSNAWALYLKLRNPGYFNFPGLVRVGDSAFFVLEMFGVLWVYRAQRAASTCRFRGEFVRRLRDVLVGGGTGLAVFGLAIPFIVDAKTRAFVNAVAPVLHPIRVESVLFVLLFGGALPVATEMVFRGIVFRTLSEYLSRTAAILTSALIFATLWPVFSPPIGVLLGVATAVFSGRQGATLLRSIVADSVLVVFAGTYAIWCFRA